jgi:hypothetical protein
MKRLNKLLSIALLVTALTSCLKDKNYEDQKYGLKGLEDKKVIELASDDSHFGSTSLNFVNRDTVLRFVAVRLAGRELATEDINVTLTLASSATLIAAYNTEHNTNFVAFPSNLYILQGGALVVTIPKGSREGFLTLKVNPSTFDPSTSYALGFRIASVDKPGYTISQNFGTYISAIGAKNIYDGVYSVVSGKVTRYTAPGVPANDVLSGNLSGNPDVVLTTVGANTVSLPPSTSSGALQWAAGNNSNVAGIDGLRVTIDPVTNLVTVTSAGNATLANWAGSTPGITYNRYDPATKTLYVAFRWNPATTTREYEVVLKYKRPR